MGFALSGPDAMIQTSRADRIDGQGEDSRVAGGGQSRCVIATANRRLTADHSLKASCTHTASDVSDPESRAADLGHPSRKRIAVYRRSVPG